MATVINNVYPAIGLTGGTDGYLDAIDGDILQNNDIAIVVTSTNVYIYHLNSTSGAAESSPDIISPDDNPGNKRWILTAIRAATTAIVGGVELATGAEAVTGTDTDRAVTPDALTDRIAAPGTIGGTTPGILNLTTLFGGVDSITATSDTVAASITTLITLVTTNGDSDLDDVSLADGAAGQVKIITCEVAGNAADSYKITPANMVEGTQITFAADPTGLGCILVWSATGWLVVGNNGGTVA